MASESLRSIYQQYKHDTEVVASWLATTAKTHGFTSPLGPAGANATASGGASKRVKGKARKQAKKTNPAPAAPAGSSKTKYTLAIRDFVPLAEHIVGVKEAAVKIPEYFEIALERVIWVRSSFSEKLAKAGAKLNSASDAKHSHFVGVLENVRKTLRPLIPAWSEKVSRPKGPTISSEQTTRQDGTPLKNLFDVLEVYEPSTTFQEAPDVVVPPSVETGYTVEDEEDSLFEAIFAMTTLMGDLSRLRGEVADLWAEYEAGNMDLAAVSVATDTAIELARSFEEPIKPLLQKQDGISAFHSQYWTSVGTALGINTERKQRFDDDYNYAAYDLSDSLFANTFANLLAFVKANPWGTKTSYNGKYGFFDENPRLEPTTNRKKYARDKSALVEALSDMALWANKPGAIEDRLTSGLRNAQKAQKQAAWGQNIDIPIWLSFAFQLYLDILKSVKIGRGWSDLKRFITTVRPAVRAAPNACPQLKRMVEEMDQWLQIDPFAIIHQFSGNRNYKQYTFFRRNPLYCGLWMHYARTLFHRHGVEYAAVPGGVMYTTQMYHAFRQEQLLEHRWEELETLWKMQGDATYFVGDPPTTPEGYWKNYCLTMGMSATSFASNRRGNKIKTSKAGERLMKFKGLTSQHISPRIQANGDQRLLTADTVQEWITKGAEGRTHHKVPVGDRLQPTDKSTDLLRKLAATIESEIPDLVFDYFTLHDNCWEVMLNIKIDIDIIKGADWSKQYKVDHRNLPFVIGVAFSLAAGKLDLERNTEPSMALMQAEARQVNRWLAEHERRNVNTHGSHENDDDEDDDDHYEQHIHGDYLDDSDDDRFRDPQYMMGLLAALSATGPITAAELDNAFASL